MESVRPRGIIPTLFIISFLREGVKKIFFEKKLAIGHNYIKLTFTFIFVVI